MPLSRFLEGDTRNTEKKQGSWTNKKIKNLFNKECRSLRKKEKDILNKWLKVFKILGNLGKSWEKAILN